MKNSTWLRCHCGGDHQACDGVCRLDCPCQLCSGWCRAMARPWPPPQIEAEDAFVASLADPQWELLA